VAEEKAMERRESLNHNIFTFDYTPLSYISTLIGEGECESMSSERGRISSRLHTEHEAPRGAQSHDAKSMT